MYTRMYNGNNEHNFEGRGGIFEFMGRDASPNLTYQWGPAMIRVIWA